MQKSFTKHVGLLLVLAMTVCSGCTGRLSTSKFITNMREDQTLPEGYGVVFGTLYPDTQLIISQGTETLLSGRPSLTSPWTPFQCKVPSGEITITYIVYDPLVFGGGEGLTYLPGAFEFAATYDVPADTAVYVGHLHMKARLVAPFVRHNQRGTVSVEVRDGMGGISSLREAISKKPILAWNLTRKGWNENYPAPMPDRFWAVCEDAERLCESFRKVLKTFTLIQHTESSW